MIIPIRCFTCGKVIGNKWVLYLKLIKQGMSQRECIDKCKLYRYCCRRMFLSQVHRL